LSDETGNQSQRQSIQQSDGDVGQISQALVKGNFAHLLPVPSRTDGRLACRPIPGRIAKNYQLCKMNKMKLQPFYPNIAATYTIFHGANLRLFWK